MSYSTYSETWVPEGVGRSLPFPARCLTIDPGTAQVSWGGSKFLKIGKTIYKNYYHIYLGLYSLYIHCIFIDSYVINYFLSFSICDEKRGYVVPQNLNTLMLILHFLQFMRRIANMPYKDNLFAWNFYQYLSDDIFLAYFPLTHTHTHTLARRYTWTTSHEVFILSEWRSQVHWLSCLLLSRPF